MSLSMPVIVGVVSAVVALIIMIIARAAGHEGGVLGNLSAICVFLAIVGVVVAIIAMLFFHVPFARIASIGNIVLLVLIPFLSIIMIFSYGITEIDDRKLDKYKLKTPCDFLGSAFTISVSLGFVSVIVIVIAGLIAALFIKVPFKQVLSACGIRLLWILAFNIVLLIFCFIADAISQKIYKDKFREMIKREEAAHDEFDTIIREAVDSNGLVDESQIKEYCKGKHITEYQDFLDFSFFIPDGLEYYISIGQIKKIETHAEKNKKVVLYQTTIPRKLSEVREEISLDDE